MLLIQQFFDTSDTVIILNEENDTDGLVENLTLTIQLCSLFNWSQRLFLFERCLKIKM